MSATEGPDKVKVVFYTEILAIISMMVVGKNMYCKMQHSIYCHIDISMLVWSNGKDTGLRACIYIRANLKLGYKKKYERQIGFFLLKITILKNKTKYKPALKSNTSIWLEMEFTSNMFLKASVCADKSKNILITNGINSCITKSIRKYFLEDI